MSRKELYRLIPALIIVGLFTCLPASIWMAQNGITYPALAVAGSGGFLITLALYWLRLYMRERRGIRQRNEYDIQNNDHRDCSDDSN